MVTRKGQAEPTGPSAVCGLAGPLLMALLSGDEAGVDASLAEARRIGADLAAIARDVVSPALEELGRMWHRGEVSIAEEHLATALVARSFSKLALAVPPPSLGAPRLVLTCLAGEFHELGIRIVAEVARSAGWQAEVLGANTPREAAIEFLSLHRPAAVGLSLALAAHLAECARTVEEIRRATPGTWVLVGGWAFRHDAALCGLTGADACFSDAVALREWLAAHREAAAGRCAAPHVESSCAAVAAALRKKVASRR